MERMVQQVIDLFPRMHVLVVGPGLGRCPLVMKATARIMEQAKASNIPLVIDADALFLLTLPEHQHIVLQQKQQQQKQEDVVMVLTPNAMEYKRLVDAIGKERLEMLLLKGIVIVQKGKHDVVVVVGAAGTRQEQQGSLYATCKEPGGLKRSGGLGDILAGTLGTFVAWNQILRNNNNNRKEEEDDDKNKRSSSSTTTTTRENKLLWACWSACCVVKKSTKAAFDQKRRAMTAPDVLEQIGSVFDNMTTTTTTTTTKGTN